MATTYGGRKVQKLPASLISSELSAHQMAPSGVIAHQRSRPALAESSRTRARRTRNFCVKLDMAFKLGIFAICVFLSEDHAPHRVQGGAISPGSLELCRKQVDIRQHCRRTLTAQ